MYFDVNTAFDCQQTLILLGFHVNAVSPLAPYAVVKEYIEKNESRVILLTATPYNKSYLDISSQLRLFIPEDKDIGISPERFIQNAGGPIEFIARYQYFPNTLLAFEKSEFAEDWQ